MSGTTPNKRKMEKIAFQLAKKKDLLLKDPIKYLQQIERLKESGGWSVKSEAAYKKNITQQIKFISDMLFAKVTHFGQFMDRNPGALTSAEAIKKKQEIELLIRHFEPFSSELGDEATVKAILAQAKGAIETHTSLQNDLEEVLSSAQQAAIAAVPSAPNLSEVKREIANFNGEIRSLKVGANFETLTEQKAKLDKGIADRRKNFESADARAAKEVEILYAKAAELKRSDPSLAALVSKTADEKFQALNHTRNMFNVGTHNLYKSKYNEIVMAAINNTSLLNSDLGAYIKQVKQLAGSQELQGKAKASYEERLVKAVQYELAKDFESSPARMLDRARSMASKSSKSQSPPKPEEIAQLDKKIDEAIKQITAYKEELTKASPSDAQALAIKNADDWLSEAREARAELAEARAKISAPKSAPIDTLPTWIGSAGDIQQGLSSKTLPKLSPLLPIPQSNRENSGSRSTRSI